MDERLIRTRPLPTQNLRSTITLVPEQRMTNMFHVCTNLVCTTRLKDTLDKCCITEALNDTIMCDSRLTDLRIRREDCHPQSILRITRNVPFDAPFIICQITPNKGIIAAMGCLIKELFTQGCLRIRRLCNHQKATRVLIYSMYQPNLRVIRVEGRHVPQMPSHCVDQCTMEVACSRMHDKTRRLVYYHQDIVLIDNI